MDQPKLHPDHEPEPKPETGQPPVEQPPPTKERHGISVWRFVIGLLIILFGVQLLGQQFGWNWAFGFDVFRLWPVFVILLGISLLSKGGVVNAVVGWLLALVLIGGVIAYTIATPSPMQTSVNTISVDQAANVTEAEFKLDLGAAKINFQGGSNELVSGRFESNVARLNVTDRTTDSRQVVTLDGRGERRWWFFGRHTNRLDVQLTDELPMSLDIDSGAADLDIDLTTVQAKRVTVDSGASSIDLRLGNRVDQLEVSIDSGAASLNIIVPTDAGLRLVLDAGVSSKSLPSELKSVGEDTYETEGYATAAKKINLTINAGASSITIKRQ